VSLDGRERAITLTARGRRVLDTHRRDSGDARHHAFHAGVGRPRELTHDASLYRAYLGVMAGREAAKNHVLIASGNAGSAAEGGPGTRRAPRTRLHLSLAGLDSAIRLLEQHLVLQNSGDLGETGTVPEGKING
jgi:hypothetical protein